MLKSQLVFFVLCLGSLMASPQKADIPGSKDHPLITRYPGLVITIYSVKDFDDFLFPLGKLDPSSSSRRASMWKAR
jgi:hypothetical protein